MSKFTFIGNGRNKNFYFTFPFFSKGDIVVKINGSVATGYGIFCVPNNSNSDFPFTGGHIHFATAPKPTNIVTIERKLQLNRLIDYQATSPLNPTTINQDMNYFFELLKDIKSSLQGFEDTYAEFTDTESSQALLSKINEVLSEIDDLGDITTLRTNVTNLGTSISNLSESLNTLSGTVGTYTTSINALNAFKQDVLDYVIATQAPTSSNNYTWYKKYKSGLVEQGGITSISTTTSNNTYFISIPLAIEMADNNYTGFCQAVFSGGSAWNGPALDIVSCTSTTAVFTGWVSGSSTIYAKTWQISGMAAA